MRSGLHFIHGRLLRNNRFETDAKYILLFNGNYFNVLSKAHESISSKYRFFVYCELLQGVDKDLLNFKSKTLVIEGYNKICFGTMNNSRLNTMQFDVVENEM